MLLFAVGAAYEAPLGYLPRRHPTVSLAPRLPRILRHLLPATHSLPREEREDDEPAPTPTTHEAPAALSAPGRHARQLAP
jgi:hypothetical protein